jgi:hypothetical protein
MPSVSPSQALTEEQRQQIIAKLLSERRSKSNCSLPEEGHVLQDRAARVQELIRQRAAAKQQHPQQGEHVIRLMQATCIQSLPTAAMRLAEEMMTHTTQHSTYLCTADVAHPTARHAAAAFAASGHLLQQASLDELLSPGSTCSLASSKAPLRSSSFAQQQRQSPTPLHNYRAAGSSVVARSMHIHSRSNPLTYSTRSDVAASLDRQLYYHDEEEDEEAVPYQQQQQEQQQYHPQAVQFAQQQQQRHQRLSAAEACLQQPQQQQQLQQQGLASALVGPVDVSQLWEAAPAASLEQSYEQPTYTEDDEEYAYDDEDEHQQDAYCDSPLGGLFGELTYCYT